MGAGNKYGSERSPTVPNCLTFRGFEGTSGLYTANLRQFGRRMSAWWGGGGGAGGGGVVERLRVAGGCA